MATTPTTPLFFGQEPWVKQVSIFIGWAEAPRPQIFLGWFNANTFHLAIGRMIWGITSCNSNPLDAKSFPRRLKTTLESKHNCLGVDQVLKFSIDWRILGSLPSEANIEAGPLDQPLPAWMSSEWRERIPRELCNPHEIRSQGDTKSFSTT